MSKNTKLTYRIMLNGNQIGKEYKTKETAMNALNKLIRTRQQEEKKAAEQTQPVGVIGSVQPQPVYESYDYYVEESKEVVQIKKTTNVIARHHNGEILLVWQGK